MIVKTMSVSARTGMPLVMGIFVAWLALMPVPAGAQTIAGLSGEPGAADALKVLASSKGSGLTFCNGNFALCAAANCTATGGKIKVNGKKFPAASCECPILTGWSIADLSGGNMMGSCDPPPGGVWSTYAPLTEVPQEYTTPAWQTVAATPLTCPGGSSGQYAECFSFSCVLDGSVNGQALAKCTCPIEKAPKQFVTAGGNCEVSNCSADLLIGAPFPTDIEACSN
jgi:hypothetical protein